MVVEHRVGALTLESRLRLDIRKDFLSMRAARPWHGLPRKAADDPSLNVLINLDEVLGSLV